MDCLASVVNITIYTKVLYVGKKKKEKRIDIKVGRLVGRSVD